MNNKKIIVVPSWVPPILTRNNLRLADTLNYDKLSKVLSVEDLSSIVSLNTLLSQHPNTDNVFKYLDISNTAYLWSTTSSNKVKTDYEIDKVILPLAGLSNTISEATQRLGENTVRKTLYTVVDAEYDTIVIIIYRGFMESLTEMKFQYGIYKRLLELFYVYYGSTQSFKTSLFNGYVRLLNKLSLA